MSNAAVKTHLVLFSLSLIFLMLSSVSPGMLSRPSSSDSIQFSMFATFSKVLRLVILSSTQLRWTFATFSLRASNIASSKMNKHTCLVLPHNTNTIQRKDLSTRHCAHMHHESLASVFQWDGHTSKSQNKTEQHYENA